jgi:hypothetical protein
MQLRTGNGAYVLSSTEPDETGVQSGLDAIVSSSDGRPVLFGKNLGRMNPT